MDNKVGNSTIEITHLDIGKILDMESTGFREVIEVVIVNGSESVGKLMRNNFLQEMHRSLL